MDVNDSAVQREPEVSFVIPAYNERDELPRTVKAIGEAAAELGRRYEVIVVDDDSTDDTSEVARGLGARVVAVQCRQISAVRNAGARTARGSVLVFVDADTRINGEVLSAAWDALDTGAIGGGAEVHFEPSDKVGWSGTGSLFVWRVVSRWRCLAAGCFVFVQRDAFERVGGFDERYFAAEEIELSKALKREGRFVILRQPVHTSPRKMEGKWAGRYGWILIKTALTLGRNLQKRDGLDPWYEDQRGR
ncbi:MAG: glycosyl transferase family 2 [Planctomycetaceae bacterium]|nr:glycosyl transferase family 2 [Planctomycetaceae bacterium]